jgi:hypothetical protein
MSDLNTEYFSKLDDQVDACQSCAQLQALSAKALESVASLQASITAQLDFLGPAQALLSAPAANPGDIVTWITSLINDFLTPQLAAYPVVLAKQAALVTQLGSLVTTITDKAAQFPDCDVPVPP